MPTHCIIFCKRTDLKKDKMTIFSIYFLWVYSVKYISGFASTYFMAALKQAIPEKTFHKKMAKSYLEFLSALRDDF
jgi:hypothetical protein